MTAVVRADETFFVAEDIGEALAKLHDVDALTFRLNPVAAEHEDPIMCPITMVRWASMETIFVN